MWQEDKPQLLLAQISKVGNGLSPVGFVEKLRDFAPLREQPEPVARMAIGLIVTQHAALIGIKGTIDAMNKEDISNLICSRFAHLALEELHKAFQLERYGELGEATAHYNLINAPYIAQVLTKYVTWLRKTRQNHPHLSLERTPREETPPAPPSRERIEALAHQMQQQYLQTGQMPLFCSWLFDAMRQVGILPDFSPEEKKLLQARYQKERHELCKENRPRYNPSASLYEEIALKKEIALKYFFEQRSVNSEQRSVSSEQKSVSRSQ